MRCFLISQASRLLSSRSLLASSLLWVGPAGPICAPDSFLINTRRSRTSCFGHLRLPISSISMSQSYITSVTPVVSCLLHTAFSCKSIQVHYKCRSMVTKSDEENGTALGGNFSQERRKGSDSYSCVTSMERLCRLGNLSDAVCLLRHFHDQQMHISLKTYNALLSSAANASQFRRFSEIFQYLLLSKSPPNSSSYINVAKALEKVVDSEIMLQFVREIMEITQHREPTVMNRIISITARSGQIDKSMMIFEVLKNTPAKENNTRSKADVVTFNTVLGILGKAGRVNQMLSEFMLMKDLGHAPDIVTYNTVINCLRRVGKFDLCKSLAMEMFEKGIDLDLRTYTALIDGSGRAGHVQEAFDKFDEMKKSEPPSIYVYRALISDLKKAGKFELASELSEEMKSSISELLGPEDFKQKMKGRCISSS